MNSNRLFVVAPLLALVSASCTLDEPISLKDATMWNDIRPGDRLITGREYRYSGSMLHFHPRRSGKRVAERPAAQVDPEWQKSLNWVPPAEPNYLPRGTVLVVERMKVHIDMILTFPAYVCRDTVTGKKWEVMRPESKVPSVREYFRTCDVRVLSGQAP